MGKTSIASDAYMMFFKEGDYVRRVGGSENLDLVPIGGVRRVQFIRDRDEKIKLLGPDSEPLLSRYYNPREFRVVSNHNRSRHSAAQSEKETTMLHLAVRVQEEGMDYAGVAAAICGDSKPGMIASTSPNDLKERVRARIRTYPDERWLILSGNTIAERSEPPVTFRQW